MDISLFSSIKGTPSESMVSDSLQIEADQKPLTWKDGLQVTVILQIGMYVSGKYSIYIINLMRFIPWHYWNNIFNNQGLKNSS